MSSTPRTAGDKVWSAQDYAANARFVADMAGPAMLELLGAQPGERVLDLGCGDGALTQKIADAGVDVIGVDGAPDMIEAAKALGLDAHVMDGQALTFSAEFDAVFTNAALHWMTRPGDVANGVFKALKPGGRYVGEFGGFANIAGIQAATRAALKIHGFAVPDAPTQYYPTAQDYTALLDGAGFCDVDARLFARPTPLPTGLRGWLETFGDGFFIGAPKSAHAALIDEMENLLAPVLRTPSGQWIADYVRLRFSARKPV